MAEVFYSPKSLDDIERIRDYICDVLCNPVAANRIVGEIFKAGDTLAEHPLMGAQFRSTLPILTYYRHLPVENYLVVYRVHGDTVHVARVLHHLQDAISILTKDG